MHTWLLFNVICLYTHKPTNLLTAHLFTKLSIRKITAEREWHFQLPPGCGINCLKLLWSSDRDGKHVCGLSLGKQAPHFYSSLLTVTLATRFPSSSLLVLNELESSFLL